MNVAVVGGSGFIGRHLVDALLERNHAVTVYDPREPVQRGPVQWVSDAHPCPAMHHDALYMLAAMADVVEVNKAPVASVRENVLLPAEVFGACVANDVPRFFFASTIWVYDAVLDHSEDGLADVTTAINPYSAAKLCAEVSLRSLEKHYGGRTQLTIMRFGIPYGPAMRMHAVMPTFVSRMLAGEELVVNGSLDVGRPFLHVRDLARGNVRLLDAPPGTYNVSGEALVTLRQIIGELALIFGRDPVVRVENQRSIDTAAQFPSIERMRELGWQPHVSLREGLSEMTQQLSGSNGQLERQEGIEAPLGAPR